MANEIKQIKKYNRFDWDGFAELHKFQLLKVEAGYKYANETREEHPSFTKALLMIVEDNSESGGVGPNQYMTLTIKFPDVSYTAENVAKLEALRGRPVELVDATAVVYGKLGNQLSVSAKTIRVAGSHEQAKAGK